jgi:hypothetical protein
MSVFPPELHSWSYLWLWDLLGPYLERIVRLWPQEIYSLTVADKHVPGSGKPRNLFLCQNVDSRVYANARRKRNTSWLTDWLTHRPTKRLNSLVQGCWAVHFGGWKPTFRRPCCRAVEVFSAVKSSHYTSGTSHGRQQHNGYISLIRNSNPEDAGSTASKTLVSNHQITRRNTPENHEFGFCAVKTSNYTSFV